MQNSDNAMEIDEAVEDEHFSSEPYEALIVNPNYITEIKQAQKDFKLTSAEIENGWEIRWTQALG